MSNGVKSRVGGLLDIRNSYKNVFVFICIVLVYFISGRLGLSFAYVNTSVTALWPPSGIAVAALLIFGQEFWPSILVGAFLVNFTLTGAFTTSVFIGMGNMLEGFVGAYLVRRFANGVNAFDNAWNVLKFAILGALVASTVSATIGVTTLNTFGLGKWAEFWNVWLTWWLGDATGIIILTPLLVLCSSDLKLKIEPRRILEGTLLIVLGAVVAFIVFGGIGQVNSFLFSYFAIFFILLAAFRLGQRETVLTMFIIELVAAYQTVNGHGPFVGRNPNDSLLLLQVYMSFVSITTVLFAAILEEHKKIEKSLGKSEESLKLEITDKIARLAEAERLHSAIIQTSPDIISLISSNGIIESVNPAFEKILGWKSSDCVGKKFEILIHPDDLGRVMSVFKRKLTGENMSPLKMRTLTSSGSYLFLESVGTLLIEDGKSPRILVCSRDITEREMASGIKSKLAAIVESTNDAVVGKDLDSKIRSWNKSAQRIYGYSESEVLGKPISILISEKMPEDVDSIMEQVKEGKEIEHYETLRRRKDGKEIRVSLTVSPIKDDNGKVIGASTISQDITEKKRLEDVERTAREQKLRADEIEAQKKQVEELYEKLKKIDMLKDELLTNTSHELKTPITPIMIQTEMLLQGYLGELSGEQTKSVQIILRNIRNLGNLIQNMLDMSALRTGGLKLHVEKTDVKEVIENVVDSMQAYAIHKTITLTAHVGVLPEVEVDRLKIGQVLINLIDNAIKFTKPNGKIEIRGRVEGEFVIISVNDNGIGISNENLAKLFQPFYQAEPSYQNKHVGTGLGLSISKAIVELHGGKIGVESTLGSGSTFYFSLRISRHEG